MKKNKFLAIVLSFALVAAMCPAFAVSAFAAEKDGKVTPVYPESVKVNNVQLNGGEYVTNSDPSTPVSDTPPR